MVTKRGSEKLETISFRGNKDKWVDFQYVIKKEGNKNAWIVMEKIIDEYIKDHSNGKVSK
ncbi:MAG: hypothetical protein PVJ67_07005 [Candidatus Pacearchaeota archaeon]|jgi:hypothetical protein